MPVSMLTDEDSRTLGCPGRKTLAKQAIEAQQEASALAEYYQELAESWKMTRIPRTCPTPRGTRVIDSMGEFASTALQACRPHANLPGALYNIILDVLRAEEANAVHLRLAVAA